jgi:NitT/TauT family transport system substrate-binding protein
MAAVKRPLDGAILPEDSMRRRTVFAAALVACLSVAAPALHAQALEKAKVTVGVGGKTLFYYLPLSIAEQKGYFKAEGLDVEILDFPGGARALQALLGGSVDIVSGAYEHTITQQSKGQNIEAVFLQGKYSSIVLVMNKAKAAQYKSPADLKGMKIGVTAPGSSTNMFVNVLLAKAALNPDDVAIIGAGATAGAVAIMQRGELDALANLDPVIAQLEAQGFPAVIDTRTAKGMQDVYGGAYAAGCIYVPVEFAKKNPNTMQAFVNAMMRALRFIQTSTPDQIVASVPADYYSDKALYKAALEKNIETYRHDGIIGAEATRNVYRDLSSFDPGVRTATIDLAKTIDMSFALKAAQKYK